MAPTVDHMKREPIKSPEGLVTAAAANLNIATANDNARAGTDAMDFVRDNRIHIEHGSIFVDPYLVIHPRELDPANEDALRKKLTLTYSINNPSFYEAPERVAVALNLGQLVPVTLGAKRSRLMEAVKKFNAEVDSGADSELQKQAQDKHNPFTAIVRDTVDHPNVDPVGLELLKNGLGVYLLLREKLTRNHYLKRETDYVVRAGTPDQVLQDLADKVEVTPQQIREAALSGGLEGIGKLLGLDPRYVSDVKELTEYAAGRDFGYNLIEHWHLGRQLLGLDAPLEDKITTGMDARITAKIAEYRGRIAHHYELPEPIQKEEARIATQDMAVLEPIQRQLMHVLGYEICFTPEVTADNIAFHKGIYGLHRKAANDLTDINGTYRIYYSGHGRREGAVGTLAHEVAHNFWPGYFSKDQVTRIDQLAESDAARFRDMRLILDTDFAAFDNLLKAYRAGDAREKQAVLASANERYANYGITVDGLFPVLRDAQSFRWMVWDANDVLKVEGARYNHSGYDTPQERFREVISRFAEMRQVSQRDEPEVLKFLAPGLTEIWEKHYIPHLEKVYQDVVKYKREHGSTTLAPTAPTTAMADNVTPLVAPANENAPKVKEEPKPQGTPVKAAADQAIPSTTVKAKSILHNAQTLAAFDALKGMGVTPGI
jgi:hypothetical protein